MRAIREKALIVFDLDGTLIDSRRDLTDSANEMLADYGAPPIGEDAIGRMVGSGAAELVRRVVAASHVNASLQDALPRFREIYDRRLLEHTRPYDGIPALLAALRERDVLLALLTNKPLQPSLRILEAFHLTEYFPFRLGGDGPWPRKPSPAGIQFLMACAGAGAAETLLVGDSIIDVRTAQNAGVRMCLARYGFGFLDLPATELTGEEWMVDAPGDIAAIVSSLPYAPS